MRLFISYAHDDKAWVRELWRELRDRADHDAWIDHRLMPSQDWWETILLKIEEAEGVIYVMTPRSVESIYCQTEIRYALALNKPVMPLMLKECEYPPELHQFQYEVIDDTKTLLDALFVIQLTLSEIRVGWLQNGYPPPKPPPERPEEPRPTAQQPEQVAETFRLAQDAASEQDFALAGDLFRQVIEADPAGYGRAAAGQLYQVGYQHGRAAASQEIGQTLANLALLVGVDGFGNIYDLEHVAEQLGLPADLIRPADARTQAQIIIDEVGAALREINTISDLARLEERLAQVINTDISLGPDLDSCLQQILDIGRTAEAALTMMQGSYGRRLSLQEAQVQILRLRNALSTTPTAGEAHPWIQPLGAIPDMLDRELASVQRKSIGYQNPYLAGSPINVRQAALFKGRRDLTNKIVDLLRVSNSRTLVLHGPRRIGKTSFLIQLSNLLPSNTVLVFFDAQGPGACQNDATFFYSLARAIHHQVHARFKSDAITRPNLSDYGAQPYTTISDWIADEVTSVLGDDYSLFIAIDEYDSIGDALENGTLTENVFSQIRYLAQHNPNITLLFAGTHTLESLGHNATTYFIGAHIFEIGYLDQNAAKELILNPDPAAGPMPEYDEETVVTILGLTHCQPFLLQAVCSEIINIANKDELTIIGPAILNPVIDHVFSTYSPYFQNLWYETGDTGREILRHLAQAGGAAVLSPDLACSPDLAGLRQRHVVYAARDDKYAIEIPLVQMWIERQG